jgi:hypothetical protein
VRVRATVRVWVPETPVTVSVVVTAVGCVVPVCELSTTGIAPPPQPSNARASRRETHLRLRANKVSDPRGISSAASVLSCGLGRAAVVAVVTDSAIGAAEPFMVTEPALGVQEPPSGAPEQLSATVPVKPETGVTLTL